MAIEINRMAHVILTVSRFEVARKFYRRLLPEFGMKVVFDGEKFFYCVGAAELLSESPGIRPQGVFVNVLDAARETWSLGHGVAQFA